MGTIPINRLVENQVNIFILGMRRKYLLNGSCKNQIDIYRKSYFLLDNPEFHRLLLSQSLYKQLVEVRLV